MRTRPAICKAGVMDARSGIEFAHQQRKAERPHGEGVGGGTYSDKLILLILLMVPGAGIEPARYY